MNQKKTKEEIEGVIIGYIIAKKEYTIVSASDVARHTGLDKGVCARHLYKLYLERRITEYVTYNKVGGYQLFVRKKMEE